MGSHGLNVLLASGLFASLVAETLPIGAMPQIQSGLHITFAQAGLMTGMFAIVAAVTTVPLAAVLCRFTTVRNVTVAFTVLGIGQVLFAVAPSYPTALGARALAALVHGIIWAQVPMLASDAAPPSQRVRATAQVFLGSSAALVLGVPLATLGAQHLGWRVSSAIPGVWSLLVACVLLSRCTRTLTESSSPHASERHSFVAVQWRSVAWVCLVTVLLVAGHFTAYTYIAEISDEHAVSGNGFVVVQALFGVAGMCGVVAAGRLTQRRPFTAAVLLTLGVTAAIAALSASSLGVFWASIVAWGALYAGAPVVLQNAVIARSGTNAALPSSLYVVAFQIGITTGSVVGSGSSTRRLPLIGAGLALVAATVTLANRRVFASANAERRRQWRGQEWCRRWLRGS